MKQDKAIFDLIAAEETRQREGLELIPSENYVSREVLDAMGSVFTNKYSEGYPGKRYYGGQENTDQVETLAIDRAKQLFNADHANVQPHSGAQANMAVYNAWLEPGDTILGMDLSEGGHLTHGAPVTQAAKFYNFIRYGQTESGELDYAEIEKQVKAASPKIVLVGYSAYSRVPDFEKVVKIVKNLHKNPDECLLVVDMAHVAGLIAGGQHPNPLDLGFHVMTTTTHKTLRGPRGGLILSKGIVSNPLKKPEKTLENIPTLIDRSVFPGTQGGPLMHVIAAKAVSFHEALQPAFRDYARQIIKNTKALAKELEKRGFHIVSGKTENHLILLDVMKSHQIGGKPLEIALDKVGLTLNANSIPRDPLPPFRPSGVRLGTPAITTRGLKEPDMAKIASWMERGIATRDDAQTLAKLRQEVKTFALQFPLPSDK
jgi:glycine hydroxymethyltransferase